jgi:hypothetical protein
MIRIATSRISLVEPTVTGVWAFLCAIGAVAIPTLMRELEGPEMGYETSVYLPFIMLSAIFLGWKHAAPVALLSAFVAAMLFYGAPAPALLETKVDLFPVGEMLLTSFLIIGFVEAVRIKLRDLITKRRGGIVLSSKDGEVWASWYGHDTPVHLGRQDDVAEMMRDFLDQTALAASWEKEPLKLKA